MKNRTINKLLLFTAVAVIASSCAKKLDLFPQNDLTPNNAYSNAAGYKAVLAKVYGGLAVTGNQGPSGSPDIQGGLDEGSQVPFIRAFFNHEELPTDEAVVAWNDQTIHDFHDLKWTSADPFIKGMYARPIYNITIANEYLREATDEKLASRGITGADATDIKKSVAEVRFLRAFNYWVMLDLFGKSTFITEKDLPGTDLPKQINRDSLFNYVKTELQAIENDLAAPKTNEYGRVDQGADWALLARLYLNAPVYLGIPTNDARAIPYYTNAITYAKKVIGASYSLVSGYNKLFMADNDKQTAEIIWAINCDGLHTQSYGNTTFFVHAASGDDHSDYGVGDGWKGYVATKALGDKFADPSGNTDKRAMFTTSKYSPTAAQMQITDVSNFDNGLHVKKYVNKRTDNQAIHDPGNSYADIDFPVFRLPEMYLIYTEAVLRGGTGGDIATALTYINKIRFRAYGDTNAGQLVQADITLPFVLDERARELYWEGHRRTDLIRYNLLTTSTYLWPWKGGVASGTSVDSKYNLYPIPAANRTANPNLEQNPGY